MDRTLARFVRAFRAAGGRVSPAEAIDAARAVAVVGYAERQQLKRVLSVVLAKSEQDKILHDDVFELFFSPPRISPGDASASELAAAANEAGVDDIRFETQKSYYVRQMTRQLGVEDIERRLLASMGQEGQDAQAQVQALLQERSSLEKQAREYVDQRYELFGRPATQQFLDQIASTRAIGRLSPQELEQMRALVARMAKRLAERHARRRRTSRRGQLDFRRTMRGNAGQDSVPFHLYWKETKRARPRLVVLCDVSGSVANHVRFLLLFLYSLAGKVADLQAFAFSDRLGDVSALLENRPFDEAMNQVLFEYGSGSTDYGDALLTLRERHWDVLDRHTTLLVLGDGRSNHADPRTDILAQAAERCKRVVWLSPEPEGRWGTGDSCMLQYRPFCSHLAYTATALDLERALDDALLAYD
jgi:uncharacterized protein